MQNRIGLIRLWRLDFVIFRKLCSLEDSILNRDELVVLAVVFLEPAEVLTDELKEKLILLELNFFTSLYELLLSSSLSHNDVRYLSQTLNELIK